MKIRGMPLGPAATNCFWLLDEEHKEAMILDPGMDPAPVLEAVRGYTVRMIVLTHGHWDHLAGVNQVHVATGAPVWIADIERDWVTDPELNRSAYWPDLFPTPVVGPRPARLLQAGESFSFGGRDFHILHVPGHTPGSLAFVMDNICFGGDTLFQDSIGRTDLPGGNTAQLLQSIRDQLFTLPDDTVVAPGHGPITTIGREKETNPFVGRAAGPGFDPTD